MAELVAELFDLVAELFDLVAELVAELFDLVAELFDLVAELAAELLDLVAEHGPNPWTVWTNNMSALLMFEAFPLGLFCLTRFCHTDFNSLCIRNAPGPCTWQHNDPQRVG